MSGLDADSLVVSSLGVRGGVHAISLSVRDGRCISQHLRITNKTSDFSFREQGQGVAKHGPELVTKNNCLLNCHAEVWTRYPVIAAIPRQAPSRTRTTSSVLYITDRDHERYEPHFKRLIKEFELSTRKPTAGRLGSIVVQALARGSIPRDTHAGVSSFPIGNWLVELLCLIPIHVAVTGLNRFIPLKDGVLSPEFERSLLGADLPQIVNRQVISLNVPCSLCGFIDATCIVSPLGGMRAFCALIWPQRRVVRITFGIRIMLTW